MTSLARTDSALHSNEDPSQLDVVTSGQVVLDVTVPVYNEERELAASVHRLHRHLAQHFPYQHTITIADNASTD